MRNAIAWSHDLLTAEEQTLFRRLAVFSGGCTLEAAEVVINPREPLDVFGGIVSLVDRACCVKRKAARANRASGCWKRCASTDWSAWTLAGKRAVRHRHAAYFAALGIAEETQFELWLAMAATLDRFERDIDNLRAAMAWAEQTVMPSLGWSSPAPSRISCFNAGSLPKGGSG